MIRRTVERLIREVWNGEREESAHELVTDPEATLAWHRDRRAAFPDLRYEVVDVLADGDRAAVRWRATGTQHGQFGPVPPTARRVSYAGATFLRFDGTGKIAEVWSVNELFQVLEQLGVRFTPEAGPSPRPG